MRRSVLLAAAVCAAAVPALAQAPAGPPPILVMNREDIKPGRLGGHDKDVARFLTVVKKTNAAMSRVALRPVTGDDNSLLYVQGYPSFAAFEETQQSFDQAIATNAALRAEMEQLDKTGDAHATQRTSVYRYRADLSYRPHTMEDFARARYVQMTVTRAKAGRAQDFIDWLKELNAAREKAGITDIHSATYSVVYGVPNGTFVTFTAIRSLKDVDTFVAGGEARSKAIDAALGGEEALKRRRAAYADAIQDSTVTLHRMDPGLSNPDAQFASYDPAFWTPAPAVASGKVTAVKKETKKN